MANEPKINTHQYQDPFAGRKVKVISLSNDKEYNSEVKELTSQEDFKTLLEEVKQYNNDSSNIKEQRIKKIINL